MPRFIYWTILIGNEPTAFRARDRDDIVPTLKQLQRRHPEAVLRWFERGKLWDSPEHARAALVEARRQRQPPRPTGWRPGGEHRDPRERFKKSREQKKRDILRKLRRGTRPGGVLEGGEEPHRRRPERPPRGSSRPPGGPGSDTGRAGPHVGPSADHPPSSRGPARKSSRRPPFRPQRGPASGRGSQSRGKPPGHGRGGRG